MAEMTDEQFARAFEAGAIAPADFGHLAHVRLAGVGVPEKYHETITELWMRLLADARSALPAPCELAELLSRRPELANKELPLEYYSPERLFSDEARARWVPPDRTDRFQEPAQSPGP